MVLERALRLLALIALVACHQSLFDAHSDHDGGSTTGDGQIASSCPMPCVGDAGHDFGTSSKWRYLDDHRDRTWAPMTGTAPMFTGANPANHITSCAAHGDAAACAQLPGALLMSSAGATATADPAIEFKAADNQVIQLQLGVFVPSGQPSQVIRVYRNSREDVLFTGTAQPGATLTSMVTLDALAGDRFLVALAPTAMGATDVGLQLFIVGTGAVFPSTCQVALPFASATGNMVDNVCGSDFTSKDDTTGPTAPSLGTGPFPELGMATTLVQNRYYDSATPLLRPGDFTIQLWIRHEMLVDSVTGAWPFSDEDLNAGGGVGMVIYDDTGSLKLSVDTCIDPVAVTFDNIVGPYPGDMGWHFVRVTYETGVLSLCIDGQRQAMKPMPGPFKSTFAPFVGRNENWTPQGSYFIGAIDDVRVFSTALPCK